MNGYTIPDIPRLYTAIAEWISCLTIVLLLKPNIQKQKLALYSAIYLAILVIFMEATATVVLWMWLPCMITAFLLIAVFIFICTKATFYQSIYYAVLAFASAEFIASLEWQIVNHAFGSISQTPPVWEITFLVLIYGLLISLMYLIFKKTTSLDKHLPISRVDWYTAIFITVLMFSFSNLRFLQLDTSVTGQYYREIVSMRTLVDIAGLAILYAHFVSRCNNAIRRELEAVQNTLNIQYQQYKQSRESINLINMKYHDLKHQIQYLRDEQDPKKRNEFLDKLENDIKTFELQNKTGNAVLDTILTGKSMYCYKHGITMTCVVDGKLLDFMEIMDICNIFGNALDNAIESVLRIEDKEKRLIHVTVSQLNDFVMIRIENYYEAQLRIDGEDYLTTKEDEKHHGYGIKSIKYTADKYDGVVHINADNNWFDIKIAIPKK